MLEIRALHFSLSSLNNNTKRKRVSCNVHGKVAPYDAFGPTGCLNEADWPCLTLCSVMDDFSLRGQVKFSSNIKILPHFTYFNTVVGQSRSSLNMSDVALYEII